MIICFDVTEYRPYSEQMIDALELAKSNMATLGLSKAHLIYEGARMWMHADSNVHDLKQLIDAKGKLELIQSRKQW